MEPRLQYTEDLLNRICAYKFPDSVFIEMPLPLKKLQQEYQKNFALFREQVLSVIGYKVGDRTVERIPDTLIIATEEGEIPPGLLELVLPPDVSKVADALKSCGFKTWDDVEKEIFSRPEYKKFYRYENLELRFCLILDVIYRVISMSEGSALFGTVKKEAAIDVMKEEFDCLGRNDSGFASMIGLQLCAGDKLRGADICKHSHYLGMLDSTRKFYERPIKAMINAYRFSSDKEWEKESKSLPKVLRPEMLGRMLLRVLPVYYYEMAKASVCPSEDMLKWYAKHAGNNSGSKRKQAKDRNRETNVEYLALYSQMPYFYIAEWLVENLRKARDRKDAFGNPALCPLIKGHEWDTGEEERGIINIFKRLAHCNISSDFERDTDALNRVKVYKKGGKSLTVPERRITQFCFFQYIVNCISAWATETGRLSRKEGNNKILLEAFRIQYLVQNAKLFRGLFNYLKKEIIGGYQDNDVSQILNGVQPSLFWCTYLNYLADKAGYCKINAGEFRQSVGDYQDIMDSISGGDQFLLNSLLEKLIEIREEKPYYDFGTDYLWFIKNQLQSVMGEIKLKGEKWRKLDKMLKSEYV